MSEICIPHRSIDMKKLNGLLPRGANKQIQKETGLSYIYISQILNGKHYNRKVVDAALNIVKNLPASQLDKKIADILIKAA